MFPVFNEIGILFDPAGNLYVIVGDEYLWMYNEHGKIIPQLPEMRYVLSISGTSSQAREEYIAAKFKHINVEDMFTEALRELNQLPGRVYRFFSSNDQLIREYGVSIGLTSAPCIVEFTEDEISRYETDLADFNDDYAHYDEYPEDDTGKRYTSIEQIPGPAVLRVWWYPEYECYLERDELLLRGSVRFTLAPDDEEEDQNEVE